MGTFADGESGSSVRTKINTAIEKTEGTTAIGTINVDGGAIDGVTLGTNSAVTEAQVDNININGNTISSTDTNGDVTIDPNGTGDVNVGNFKFDADQTVGAGQDNYVLTYDNSGGKISLEAAGGGGGGGDFTLISTTNITSSVASADISLGGSYTVYMLVITELVSALANSYLKIRVSDDNGTTFESGNNYWTIGELRHQTTGSGGSGTLNNGGNQLKTDGAILQDGGITSDDMRGSTIYITGADNSSLPTNFRSFSSSADASGNGLSYSSVTYNQTSVITDVRIFFPSGNISSGIIKLYGLS